MAATTAQTTELQEDQEALAVLGGEWEGLEEVVMHRHRRPWEEVDEVGKGLGDAGSPRLPPPGPAFLRALWQSDTFLSLSLCAQPGARSWRHIDPSGTSTRVVILLCSLLYHETD